MTKMTNEISPMQSVQDRIADKIKAEFVDLMPPEVWKQLVEAQLQAFQSKTTSYGHSQEAPIAKLIREAIEAEAKTALKTQLDLVFTNTWVDANGKQVLGDAMKALIAEHFDTILASVQAGMVQQAVMFATQSMRNAIMNSGGRL